MPKLWRSIVLALVAALMIYGVANAGREGSGIGGWLWNPWHGQLARNQTRAQTMALLRIRGSTAAYTDSQGHIWSPEGGYVNSGGEVTNSSTVANTSDSTLYQSHHCGGNCSGTNGSFTYTFDVNQTGLYTVRLKFAEQWFSASGSRVFNIVIDGTTAASSFDIYAAALAEPGNTTGSGKNYAVDESYPVTVTGASITVELQQVTDDPDISAIEIDGPSGTAIAMGPTPTPSPTPSPGAYTPVSGYLTSQVGNTDPGGGLHSAGFKYVQAGCYDIAVMGNGNVFATDYWDEGNNELGIYANGHNTGEQACNTGNPSGGWAAASNGTNAFVADNTGGFHELNADGTATASCARYFVATEPTNSGVYSSYPEPSIYGLAASSSQVFASDGPDNLIKIFNIGNTSPVSSFSFTRPGRIAYNPADGTLWVAQRLNQPIAMGGPTIYKCTTGGSCAVAITLEGGGLAMGLAFSGGNLLVADAGTDMQVKAYNPGTDALVTRYGPQGGFIASAQAGAISNGALAYPSGMGVDSSGNIYVSEQIFPGNYYPSLDDTQDFSSIAITYGCDIRAFSPSWSPLWTAEGHVFSAAADVDPGADGQTAYTDYDAFSMNYANQTAGAEQTWTGKTIDAVDYPNDLRLVLDAANYRGEGALGVANVSGHKYMFTSGGDGGDIEGCYFANGTICRPMVVVNTTCGGHNKGATHPCTVQDWGGSLINTNYTFLWSDANGNGSPDSGEIQQNGSTGPLQIGNQEYSIDPTTGDIWLANTGNGVDELKASAPDAHGDLDYSLSNYAGYGKLGFQEVNGVVYDPATDRLIVSGYVGAPPSNFCDGQLRAGDSVRVFNNFVVGGNRTAAFTVTFPTGTASGGCALPLIRDIAYAGGKIFGAKTEPVWGSPTSPITDVVYVWSATSGALLGTIYPKQSVNPAIGWMDVSTVIRAYQRANGEYLIFAQEEMNARTDLFRGLLSTFNQY